MDDITMRVVFIVLLVGVATLIWLRPQYFPGRILTERRPERAPEPTKSIGEVMADALTNAVGALRVPPARSAYIGRRAMVFDSRGRRRVGTVIRGHSVLAISADGQTFRRKRRKVQLLAA